MNKWGIWPVPANTEMWKKHMYQELFVSNWKTKRSEKRNERLWNNNISLLRSLYFYFFLIFDDTLVCISSPFLTFNFFFSRFLKWTRSMEMIRSFQFSYGKRIKDQKSAFKLVEVPILQRSPPTNCKNNNV